MWQGFLALPATLRYDGRMQGREHPRYAAELEAEITVDGERLPGRSKDLSRGGLSVTVAKQVVAGSLAKLRLALVFDEETFSEWLEIEARVVWCAPVGRSGQFQLGLSYQKVTPEARKYLDLFLRHITEAEKAGV